MTETNSRLASPDHAAGERTVDLRLARRRNDRAAQLVEDAARRLGFKRTNPLRLVR